MAAESITLCRCSKCNAKMIVQRASGEIVILQRALVVRGDSVFAICPECRHENEIGGLTYRTTRLIVSENSQNSQERLGLTNEAGGVIISS